MTENPYPEDIPPLPGEDPELSRIRTPPHSIEAEQSVLGGLMLAPDTWEVVAEVLSTEDFYRPDHGRIFAQIGRLVEAGQPVDVVTVAEALDARDELESSGTFAYLAELARETPSAANVRAYAGVVRERALLRHLITAAQSISESGYNPEGRDATALVDAAERQILAIMGGGSGSGRLQEVRTLVDKTVDHIGERIKSQGALAGIATGFRKIDELTSGLQGSDLVIVAGRPSMGKTSFAMNLAEHAIFNQDKPVLVFSMEMSGHQLVTRLLSSIAHIDQGSIRDGQLNQDEWDRIGAAANRLKGVPLFIDDSPALTPGEVRARARRVSREKGVLGLIVIDYLQLMQVSGFSEGRTAEISEISRELKAVARELECPVLALSQLNRSLEGRQNKRPVLSDLRESGAIEQDADLIMFIYRDEVYNEDSPDKGTAEIIIGKQRNGPIGVVKLAFVNKYTRFEQLERQEYDSPPQDQD